MTRACSTHRAGLAELVAASSGRDRPADLSAAARSAAAHAAVCEACRLEAEELTLVSFAVRRAWADADALEPPADAWPRLRARIVRRPPRRTWSASSVVGLAMGMALTIGLIAPMGVTIPFSDHDRTVVGEAGVEGLALAVQPSPEEGMERQWLRLQLVERARLAEQTRHAPVLAPAAPRRGPLSPRREQMRYAEDPARDATAWLPSVPPMRVL